MDAHNFSAESLDFQQITSYLRERITTCYGVNCLDQIKPLAKNEALRQMALIQEIRELRNNYITFRFSGITEIDGLIERLKRGGDLNMDELFQMREALRICETVRRTIHDNGENAPELSSHILTRLVNLADLNEHLCRVITDEGELNFSSFPHLKKLSEAISSAKKDITERLMKLINSASNEKHIQESILDTRGGKYVILLKTSSKGQIPGTVMDISSSGQTLYLEPETIREANSALASKRVELDIEIRRIITEIVDGLRESSGDILSNSKTCGYLEFLNSASFLAQETSANIPLISENFAVKLFSARHPLLHIIKKDVVANDIIIPQGVCGMIISGANAGGKTIALKTLGLCALMTRYGFPIPASPDSEIPFFKNILSDIGDDQSISLSLSTYSGQINSIKRMVDECMEGTLILIDEIISGTNPHYGAALARGVLEEFASRGGKCLVTTHYPELKKLASEDSRFINASVVFDPDTLRPMYRLRAGIPGMSFTFEIAEMLNLPGKIISRAKNIAGSDELSMEAMIDKIQRYETELMEEKARIAEIKKRLDEEISENADLQQKLKMKIKDAKEFKGIEFIDEISEMKEKLRQKIRDLNSMGIKEAEKFRSELDAAAGEVLHSVTEIKKESLLEKFSQFDAKAAKGTVVHIISLNAEGMIDSVDPSGKNASIILKNGMKTRFPSSDILIKSAPPAERKKPQKNAAKANPDDAIPVTMQTSYNTVDLRGMRVEEALSKLERELDEMTRKNVATAVVIHGHGTGALKEAVRSSLKFSHYAISFRSGESGEGGSGVTIVRLG